MIIDMHTHVYPDELASRAVKAVTDPCGVIPFADGTAHDVKEKLISRGISRAVVLEIATKAASADAINTYAAANLNDGFFIPFATVHPAAEGNKERIVALKKSGFKGIKLHPYFQDFDVLGSEAMNIYEQIERNGLILTMHTGYDPSFVDDGRIAPQKVAAIKKSFPALKLVAAHCGGMKQADETIKYLVGTDIYFDISMTNNYYSMADFKYIMTNHDPDKLLFASDAPWDDPQKQLDFLFEAQLPQELNEKILWKNADNLLENLE